jgi:aryl-alcohol dehydrogenase-like predicted oxidoreductase
MGSAMKYREVGDLRLSEVGFGCGGNAGLMLRGDPATQRRVVARALELGINYFDNAPDYGDGLAETNLGRVLKALGARPHLNTKVEIRAAHLDDVASHVERSVEASLTRLGVDCVDILQIHNGPTYDLPALQGNSYTQLGMEHYLGAKGATEGLARVLRAGKARHAGFICRGNDAPAVRALIDTGMFRLINVAYSLLNPSAGQPTPPGMRVERDHGDVMTYARSKGVGVAVFSPLAGGVLSDHRLGGGHLHALAERRANTATADAANLERARAFRFLAGRVPIRADASGRNHRLVGRVRARAAGGDCSGCL